MEKTIEKETAEKLLELLRNDKQFSLNEFTAIMKVIIFNTKNLR